MAAKRIAQSTINWASIAERVPSNQKHLYLAFKAKSDVYLRKVVALPENPPKIDWALYKSKSPLPSMIDEFQKKYETFTIPLPDDSSALSKIAAAEKDAAEFVNKFKAECTSSIAQLEEELKETEAKGSVKDMTLEEFAYAYPDEALDALNKPTFWPHDESSALEPENNKEKGQH